MLKKLILIVLLMLSAPVFAQSSDALAPTNEQLNEDSQISKKSTQVEEKIVKQYSELTLDETIDKFSAEYNVPKAWLVNLATCESSYGTNLTGDNGHAYGVYQYWIPTWLDFERMFNIDLNRNSQYDQVKMTAIALSKGYGYRWSCDYKTGKVK